MAGVTYTKNIALTNTWNQGFSGSGSGTIYTVPTDEYIELTTISVSNITTSYNVYVSGAKVLTSATNANGDLNGKVAVSGQTVSFDSVGGSGSTSVTIYFRSFKNAI